MKEQFDFLSDYTEQTTVRYVCFITDQLDRFDLAIVSTQQFYGKKLVCDLQSGLTRIIGPDDLKDSMYLQSAFQLEEEAAEQLLLFLEQVIGPVHYPTD